MNITMILDMASSVDDRLVVTSGARSVTGAELKQLARRAADSFRGCAAVLYEGVNHLAYPVALFGAAYAGIPFVPLNYRLGDVALAALEAKHEGARILRSEDLDGWITGLDDRPDPTDDDLDADLTNPDAVAVVIYTSGTTSEPKPAILRHRHLLAYVLNTLEFSSAAVGDAALVAVPPYHIAGLTNLMSNLYTGRRIVYASGFDARQWIDTVRAESVTHAMLVPTMLARVVDVLAGEGGDLPSLATLAYGGARTPRAVIERALDVLPTTGFVNAYGLTETASSIAVLGPDDHRAAATSADPVVRARLGSVGRALPGIDIEIRDPEGTVLQPGQEGLVFVRGDQISGEYGSRSVLDDEGWFATRDLGRLDADGFLYIEGRADDTIIRGGENIAPAEIEDVLITHPTVTEAAVIGVPDPEWGQRLVAVVVGEGDPEEIRAWVKERLRSSKTPDSIIITTELPRTETGKLIRRKLLADLSAAAPQPELEKNHA
ncbi:class I adenylate-forming enzyme family protein [Gordonia rhizosphera]|uniref:Putative acid--CoA ligase n=1 Tax=Gordonia rhizosphera NBRC 16068 TaxID=1108045 RepID=K6WT16_9ACTN|nr:fatty acid--CoA ligase family protein [Gordonia rhizosphera]GAB89699.1 putative acid--CoA ligase [Gordonia rhizosphera NBRC 16068]